MATILRNKYRYWSRITYLIRIHYILLLLLFSKYFVNFSNSSQIGNIDKNLSKKSTYYNGTNDLRNSRALTQEISSENSKQSFDSIQNTSLHIDQNNRNQFLEQIYGELGSDGTARDEQIAQMSSWLSNEDSILFNKEKPYIQEYTESQIDKSKNNREVVHQQSRSGDFAKAEALKADKLKNQQHSQQHHNQQHLNQQHLNQQHLNQQHLNHQHLKQSATQLMSSQNHKNEEEENDTSGNHNYESLEDDNGPSGTTKMPPCANYGRYYCSYKEDYPIKVVTEVTKYYKWPLEKLFRDLRHQVMPTLANDNNGGLVCDSITRIIRAGWAKNTNGRWLVVINTDYYQQYVTEVICRHGTGSYCNFIPPCYHASCRQRYNTQKLLVIDPWNPYKGPFLSEFLFPSCCICFVPDSHDSTQSSSNIIRNKFASVHHNPKSAPEKESSSSVVESLSPSPSLSTS